ncbi:MAG TPA: ComEC/Rec2 family competence protein [Lacunisphaera sp.]
MPAPALSIRAPLLWLLLPFMAGLAAAWIWPAPSAGLWPLSLSAVLTALLALAGAIRNQPRLWAPAILLSAGLSGCFLLHLRHPQLHDWESRPPREITVVLEVSHPFPSAPQARSFTGLGTIVDADAYDRALIGRRIYFSAIRRISVLPVRSGRYELRGVIEPLPRVTAGNGFTDYLVNLGIRHRVTRAHLVREIAPPGRFAAFCTAAEKRLETILRRGLDAHPGVQSVYLAMLLGEKAVLNADQQNAFMRSGTFHIFSISGLHVGVIAAALHALAQSVRAPRRPAVFVTVAVLWLYVQVTGGGAPALRAFLMIAFLLSTRIFRLPGNSLAALTASALFTLLLDPLQLFSTGFQMSYSVVATLILMGAPLAERWQSRWQPFALRPRPEWRWQHHVISRLGRKALGAAAGCWAAFLASAASGIGFFGLFSPGSLPANLVIIPLSSLAIIAGFLALLAGLTGLLPVSALFNAAAGVIIIATDWLLLHGIALPGMFFTARFRTEWLAPLAMVLMTAVMLAGASGRWARRYGGYWPPVILLALLMIFGVKFG